MFSGFSEATTIGIGAGLFGFIIMILIMLIITIILKYRRVYKHHDGTSEMMPAS